MADTTSAHPSSDLPPKRGRGRPRRTEAETEVIRQQIQQAATQVFAERGYHGVSVELILQASGLSRPTFYRYFGNADEVIELILKEANDRLLVAISESVRQAQGPIDKVEAGLLAWRTWGESIGPLLKAIFAELHDTHSPAYVHRQRVLKLVGEELNAAAASLQRPPFDDLQIETFVIGVEYLGFRYHFGPEGPSEAMWERTRQAMVRLAVGLLGGPQEWAHATQLAEVMRVTLR